MKTPSKSALFVGLFLVLFFVQLALFGLLWISHTYHPRLSLALFPAMVVAVAAGGAHTAGVASYVVGVTLTAAVYAGVGVVLFAFVAKR